MHGQKKMSLITETSIFDPERESLRGLFSDVRSMRWLDRKVNRRLHGLYNKKFSAIPKTPTGGQENAKRPETY